MCAGDSSIGRMGVVAGLQRSGLSREIDTAVKKVMPLYVTMRHGLDRRKQDGAKGRGKARAAGQGRLG